MTGTETTGRRPARSTPSKFTLWYIFAGVAGLFVGFDLLDGQPFYLDVDDRMRALQIRDLLRDGQWFDLRLPFITMPEPYVSPWSRLVDLPYAAIVYALSPLAGFEFAFRIAGWVWPLVLLGIYAWLIVRALTFVIGSRPKILHLVVIAILSLLCVLEFVPGRIDHHNFQIVLMLVLVTGLVDRQARRGGIWTGLAVILSLEIGLECLPFLALALAGQAVAAIAGRGEGGKIASVRLMTIGYTLFAGALPVALVFKGWAGTVTPVCDAYSLPWVLGLMATGQTFAVVPRFWTDTLDAGLRAVIVRAVSLAVPGAIIAGGLGVIFPVCLSGPYHMIDPVSEAFWLSRVYQELSALALIVDGQYMIVAVVAILACICIAAIPAIIAKVQSGDYGVAIVFAMAVMALVLGAVVIRFIRFPAVFGPLLLPLALASLNTHSRTAASAVFKSALVAPLALAIILVVLLPKRNNSAADPADIVAAMECTGQDKNVLDTVSAGKVIALSGLSLAIAERRGKQKVAHSVAALSFHRASPGIARVAQAFTSSDEGIVRKALAPFNYLAICLPPTGMKLPSFPLYRKLVQGKKVSGLVAVDSAAMTRFKLYRIVKPGK